MNNKTFAYIRVSTKDQNEARQLDALKPFNINERDIFIDKQSGKSFDRPNYQALKHNLREGDLLIIKSIDRLGRNYEQIKNEWQEITKDIKANIKVIDMPLLDTTNKVEGLTGQFISDLFLQVLSYVAETELNNINQRRKEGQEHARAIGKHIGRPTTVKPDNFEEVIAEWKNGNITAKRAMELTGLKRTNFYKLVK